MECAWISNFVILETEALLTFCQEEHGVGSERARAGAGLKAGFLRQKNIRTKEVCANKNILFFCPNFCGVRVERAHRVQKEAPSYRRERPKVKCPQKVGRVKYYPVIERVRYCTGLFPFNRDLILLLL